MKKLEGNKLAALLLSAGMVTTLLAACTINTDELGQGISDLGNAFTSQTVRETEKTKETTETTESQETSGTEETVETVTETTAVPTSTATPSPTPLPQRVDFSDYTEIDLTDAFKVTVEEFGEKTYSDDNKELLATFEGNRLVVTEASNKTVMDSINLIVDGFYTEAEGAYARAVANAKAEYNLSGVVELPSAVNVDFSYTTNGRILSVLMSYEVSGAAANAGKVIDFASFDMLSGQYINLTSVSVDPAGLEEALKRGLENTLRAQPTPTPALTPATTQPSGSATVETTVETTEALRIPSASDIDILYVAAGPAADENSGNSFVTVYGIADGEIYSAVIDITPYAAFFNRYGVSVYQIAQPEV